MKIILESFQDTWRDLFLGHHYRIATALSAFAPTIEHIGSTSVQGLCAKPIIDILVGLNDSSDLDNIVPFMQSAHYTYYKKLEHLWATRRYFVQLKSDLDLTPPNIVDVQDEFITGKPFFSVCNIHIIMKDGVDWLRHIAFREYLRNNSLVRDAYASLKQEISKLEFKNTMEYNNAKNDFIKDTEQKALAWYKDRISTL